MGGGQSPPLFLPLAHSGLYMYKTMVHIILKVANGHVYLKNYPLLAEKIITKPQKHLKDYNPHKDDDRWLIEIFQFSIFFKIILNRQSDR